MTAKKSKGQIAGERRAGHADAELLEENISQLRGMAAELEGLLDVFGDLGIEQVKFDGFTKFERGKVLIQGYIDNVDSAIKKTRREQM